jgi:hypothetical protein
VSDVSPKRKRVASPKKTGSHVKRAKKAGKCFLMYNTCFIFMSCTCLIVPVMFSYSLGKRKGGVSKRKGGGRRKRGVCIYV